MSLTRLEFNIISFGSLNYYKENELLIKTANTLMDAVEKKVIAENKDIVINRIIVSDMEGVNKIKELDFGVIIPMSGAVQPLVTELAKKIKYMCVWAAYIKGQSNLQTEVLVLENNAAPALMDIFAVLKRTYKNVSLAKNIDEIYLNYKVVNGIDRFKKSKLMVIGQTEPWVISANKDYDRVKEKFNIDTINITLEELYEVYNNVDITKAEKLSAKWSKKATAIVEPSKDDLINSAKLTIAINSLVEKHEVDAVALACFKLLHDIGTTGCMALSTINDSLDCVASCEGDMDSAITLLLVKCISGKPAFMANPNLQSDGSVNFVHCTSAFNTSSISGDDFILRNHHESGIGVSPQVTLKTDTDVLLVRVGDNLEKMTILKGYAKEPIQEKTCRTKILIDFEDPEEYINTALGCHQVIVYDTDMKAFIKAKEILGLV